ncbi:MAG: hypothetical protein FWB92_02800 [Oscillospiraceae bacterium]|nr:hypothetical protein [Oscillospiraceae bacterium]
MYRVRYGNKYRDYETALQAYDSEYLKTVIPKSADFVDSFCALLEAGEVLHNEDPISGAEIKVSRLL